MSASLDTQRPSDEGVALAALPSGLSVSLVNEDTLTLAALPVGARLILRCRKDWRDATISAATPEAIILSINAPSGRTYRIKRPPHTPLAFDGLIPVLGEGHWRAGFARYDARW
ncbi:MAG TPA: hypothetical protein VEQ40_10520 [Pyrinomonadaceae bacterium]|nr:hypothetical protein [Pyrinomonadaceae bacterium]